MAPPLESWQFESFLSSRYCYSTSTLYYCNSYDSPTQRVLRDGSYTLMRCNEYDRFGSRFLLIPITSSLLCFASLCTSFLQSSEPSLLFSNHLQKKVPSPGFKPSSLRANSPKARINPRGHGASLSLGWPYYGAKYSCNRCFRLPFRMLVSALSSF